MNFRFEKRDGMGLLTFKGEFTEDRADDIRSVFVISLYNSKQLVLNLEKVTRVDPSCFQLLCRLCNLSRALNKRLTLTGVRPEIFRWEERQVDDTAEGAKDIVGTVNTIS